MNVGNCFLPQIPQFDYSGSAPRPAQVDCLLIDLNMTRKWFHIFVNW